MYSRRSFISSVVKSYGQQITEKPQQPWNIRTLGYADDIVIAARAKFITITDLNQRALRRVEQWCLEENLRVNKGKTRMVPITGTHIVIETCLEHFSIDYLIKRYGGMMCIPSHYKMPKYNDVLLKQ